MLPAHAGMIPASAKHCRMWRSAPRSRGDDPYITAVTPRWNAVLPAHAGMIPSVPYMALAVVVLPAHAGMIPPKTPHTGVFFRAPRSRGDDPRIAVPCPSPLRCSPLTRG